VHQALTLGLRRPHGHRSRLSTTFGKGNNNDQAKHSHGTSKRSDIRGVHRALAGGPRSSLRCAASVKAVCSEYIQNHVTGDALPGTTASKFDGIAEIWFNDMAGAKAFFASDTYRQNVIPDEEEFMDRKRCELLFTHEHNVMP
jgi:EthD domain